MEDRACPPTSRRAAGTSPPSGSFFARALARLRGRDQGPRGHYKPHPDPAQERFFFGLLRDCLAAGAIARSVVEEEIEQRHVRRDALALVDSIPLSASADWTTHASGRGRALRKLAFEQGAHPGGGALGLVERRRRRRGEGAAERQGATGSTSAACSGGGRADSGPALCRELGQSTREGPGRHLRVLGERQDERRRNCLTGERSDRRSGSSTIHTRFPCCRLR